MPGTACRLLQSKRSTSTTTKRPSSAAPHPQSPAGAAFLPEVAPFRARSGLRMACLACARWPAEVPRARGCWWRGDAGSVATSPTAIARGRSFAPTRSTRAPHVASRDERRPETTVSPEARCARLPRLTSHADACAPSCVPGPAAAGAPGKGRFACPPAKVSSLCRARGAFHSFFSGYCPYDKVPGR
jgi:hypothetical protein